ncbi:Peptidyl-prolyl cis-trans isomerase fkbp19, chloroplastic [Turnera subulata]|uniref:peptidylprolyl isomerase n=1 Tax=Turnera subulata TaxID=218843 RepID=A0A9Q0G5S7_9ROSI|nr:Peptidyl-prolyl cis-trans isomerase fkbp19, chloroplastic [Turnera subulata]
MASISAAGILPQPLRTSSRKVSTTTTIRCRGPTSSLPLHQPESSSSSSSSNSCLTVERRIDGVGRGGGIERRQLVMLSVGFLAGLALGNGSDDDNEIAAAASEFADRLTVVHTFEHAVPALRGKDYGKTKMRYPDYTETESGLQYKDLRVGSGRTPKMGETVVVDWDGYTIGYYGRIFEARNKTKGGSFEGDDKDFFKFKLGSRQVIPAFEEAVSGMSLGGVRRIIVPPELGYPENDYNKSGPRPTTFSGQRALDFVLKNQGLIDKTLLFDIELLKIV